MSISVKEKANKEGAYEAIMIMADGTVSEGSSSNVWLVKKNQLITREANFNILNGITRRAILKIAKVKNLNIEERKFDKKEMFESDEVFITSATSIVTGITDIDGKKINSG